MTHLVLAATSGGIDVRALGAKDWRPDYRESFHNAPDWVFERGPDLTEDLKTLAVPTILVWASADPVSPVAIDRRLHELIPHSRLVVLDGDDHWVARSRAAEVAAEIAAHVWDA